MPRPAVIAAAALLCATALACGGDTSPGARPSSQAPSSSAPAARELTKAEYVAAVNVLCTRVESEADAIGEPKTAEDYATSTKALIGILDKAQAEARALKPPAADVAEIEQNFLTPNDEQAARFKAALPKVEAAAQQGDTQAAQAAFGEAVGTYDAEVQAQEKWMTGYGITACV